MIRIKNKRNCNLALVYFILLYRQFSNESRLGLGSDHWRPNI